MSFATYTDRCMFFVGGNAAKSTSPTGSNLAGGCTRTWWDSQPNIDTTAGKQNAMGKLMNADGSPIITADCTMSNNGSGNVRLLSEVAGSFSGSEIGMLLYHPDYDSWMEGEGIFKIIDVDVSGDWVDIDNEYMWSPGDVETAYVGGAWNDVEPLISAYTDSYYHTQEVWVNKDLAPSKWDWWYWNGNKIRNTFLILQGFNRVPGDITRTVGDYYQSIHDARNIGIEADSFVAFDFSGLTPSTAVELDNAQNIVFAGFHCFGYNYRTFEGGGGGASNLIFRHNIIHSVSYAAIQIASSKHILIFDNWLKSTNYNAVTLGADGLFIVNNIIESLTEQAIASAGSTGAVVNNLLSGGKAPCGLIPDCNFLVYGNTMIDGVTIGGIRTGGNNSTTYCSISSLNNIIVPTDTAVRAYEMLDSDTYGFGSIFADNDCCYAENGQLIDLLLAPKVAGGGYLGDNILEVDPLLDSGNDSPEPLENEVRIGGTLNIIGDRQSIGAVQTMNTDIVNTAVQAAMTSQGYTTARAPKLDELDQSISSVDALVDAVIVKTDNLPADPAGVSDLASIDVSSCKLAADGLDNVVVAEPTGDPSGWSFAKCLRWLIMRFMNKHTSDNFNGITVHKADDSVSTTQAVTDASGTKTVGKVQ